MVVFKNLTFFPGARDSRRDSDRQVQTARPVRRDSQAEVPRCHGVHPQREGRQASQHPRAQHQGRIQSLPPAHQCRRRGRGKSLLSK